MSIENAVKDVITQKLEEGIIERLVAENLEKGINKALESLLGSYGDVTKIIEERIKDVMVKQLESYDYSQYVVKLDCVLSEILQHTALDNKQILENFKKLMVDCEIPKVIKVTEIFKEWKKFVSKNIDTSDLEIDYDDGVSYEYVNVTMEIEREEDRSWSSFKGAKIVFECEKDENLNLEIRLSKFKEYPWEISALDIDTSIKSLRYLDDFKIYLLQLSQSDPKIEIDEEYLSDDVRPEKEPEASFS